MLRCSFRRLQVTTRLNFNNFQDFADDRIVLFFYICFYFVFSFVHSNYRFHNCKTEKSLPTRSFINSLFCQQVDVDWLKLYPTLPSQQIANVVYEESEKLARLVKTGETLDDMLFRAQL